MLKYIVKKKSDGSVISSMTVPDIHVGETWVAQESGKGSFGRNDLTIPESELESHNLTAEEATSVETVDEVPMYNFAKVWEVEIKDLSVAENRSAIRSECLKVIDYIAGLNDASNASDATMDAIFSSPTYIAIILALVTGAPKTAKRLIMASGTALYSSEQIADIGGQLDAIIASEGV